VWEEISMDIDYFLRTKYEENQVEGVLRTEELYKNIAEFQHFNILFIQPKC